MTVSLSRTLPPTLLSLVLLVACAPGEGPSTLRFELGDQPASAWGTGVDDVPPSFGPGGP